MRRFDIGDLVIGKKVWWGKTSYLDSRFCESPGVVSAFDKESDVLYFVTFDFGTYRMQERDLILI